MHHFYFCYYQTSLEHLFHQSLFTLLYPMVAIIMPLRQCVFKLLKSCYYLSLFVFPSSNRLFLRELEKTTCFELHLCTLIKHAFISLFSHFQFSIFGRYTKNHNKLAHYNYYVPKAKIFSIPFGLCFFAFLLFYSSLPLAFLLSLSKYICTTKFVFKS